MTDQTRLIDELNLLYAHYVESINDAVAADDLARGPGRGTLDTVERVGRIQPPKRVVESPGRDRSGPRP